MPGGNATEFAAELNAHGAVIEGEALGQKRQVALELMRGVVFGNPVGNPRLWKRRKAPKGYVGGYSRSNWQLASGEPPQGVVDGIRTGEAVLAEAEGLAGAITLRETAWVANNAPYIGELEFKGHSSQARDGWVRAVVERVKAKYGAD